MPSSSLVKVKLSWVVYGGVVGEVEYKAISASNHIKVEVEAELSLDEV